MPRLDFSANEMVSNGYTTPTLDEHGPMDDYLGSSPTPKAAEKARSKLNQITLANEDIGLGGPGDAADSDVPSSPPEIPDDTDYGEIPEVTMTIEEEEAQLDEADNAIETTEMQIDTEDRAEEVPMVEPVDATADQEVPPPTNVVATETDHNAQETAIAKGLEEGHGVQNGTTVEDADVYEDAPTEPNDNAERATDAEIRDASSSPIRFTDSVSNPSSLGAASATIHDGATKEEPFVEPSHVEDSFAACNADSPTTPVKSVVEESFTSQPTTQRRSKRKRSESGSATPIKRRKSVNSPLKRIFSWVTGSQEQDDDDEMGECIVVASQPEQSANPAETPVGPSSAPVSVESSRTRRGRGRPSKSDTAVAATPSQNPRAQQLKRNSSVLSTDSRNSAVNDSHGPRKSRRITRSQGQTPDVAVEVPRTSRRVASAVLIDTSQADEERVQESDGDGTDGGANSQLHMEQEVAVRRDRVIAKPKSIMEKLKSILSDCKTLVLGSQEYRELDDVLFEVRREVHEAASRGKE